MALDKARIALYTGRGTHIMKMMHIIDGPPLYTNCFVLVGDKGHAVVIDPAAKLKQFVQVLEDNNATLTHILLTHGHNDHIGSAQALREKYDAKLYVNEADAIIFGIDYDMPYVDGGILTIDDMTFETIFTPGHSPGSTCIRCGDLLFSGDTLFAGDIGRTDFGGGDPEAMRQSLNKLCRLIVDDVKVLPGHEEFSTMQHEKMTNPYLRF